MKLHPNEFIAILNLRGGDLESIRGSDHKLISVVCKKGSHTISSNVPKENVGHNNEFIY